MLLNKSSLRKGNVLVMTVILLAAISTVTAGITGYFVSRSRLDNKINEPAIIKRELYNQFADIYEKLIKNEDQFEGKTIHQHLASLEQGNSVTLVNNTFNNKFTYTGLLDDEKHYFYSIGYSGFLLTASISYELVSSTYAYKEVYFR